MTIHSHGTQSGSTGPTAPNDGPVRLRSISREEIQRVLDSDRRREAVECVLAADEQIAVRTLVGHLADAENDATVVTTLHELRQRVYVSLCQTHLPVLESHGIVTYDRDRGIVSPGANLAVIELALADDAHAEPSETRFE